MADHVLGSALVDLDLPLRLELKEIASVRRGSGEVSFGHGKD